MSNHLVGLCIQAPLCTNRYAWKNILYKKPTKAEASNHASIQQHPAPVLQHHNAIRGYDARLGSEVLPWKINMEPEVMMVWFR